MNLKEAMDTLDGVIPELGNRMVDPGHMPIAQAWAECRKTLLDYGMMKNRYDAVMRRHDGLIETIRQWADEGLLSYAQRELLEELHLLRRS